MGTIRVDSKELMEELQKIRGVLIAESGHDKSMEDTLAWLVQLYRRKVEPNLKVEDGDVKVHKK